MNGINVTRYGTEAHKMRLSRKFYDLRATYRASIKIPMHNLVNWNEITSAFGIAPRALHRWESEESSALLYLQIFQSPKWAAAASRRNAALPERSKSRNSARRAASVVRCTQITYRSNALIPMSERPREYYCPRNCRDQSLAANGIKRKAVTKLPHNNYRDWHRSRADNRREVELRPHYICKLLSGAHRSSGRTKSGQWRWNIAHNINITRNSLRMSQFAKIKKNACSCITHLSN